MMDGILVCIQGESNDLRMSYPEDEVIQLNYCKLSDLNFTSYSNDGTIISQFTFNNCLALKICTPEAIIQMDSINQSFTIQSIITPTEQSILVSTQNSNVITVHALDSMLSTYKPFLETIPEEQDDLSLQDKSSRKKKNKQQFTLDFIPQTQKKHNNNKINEIQKKKIHATNIFEKENQKNKSNRKSTPKKKLSSYQPQSPNKKQSPSKKVSPNKSPPQKAKKSIDSTNRTRKTTGKATNLSIIQGSPSKMNSPNRKDNRQDYVDVLLAQLIQQNNKRNKSKKRRPSTAYPLRPKIDSEGMIDRQWLEEEMINEDL